jgi:hypothetical protein
MCRIEEHSEIYFNGQITELKCATFTLGLSREGLHSSLSENTIFQPQKFSITI